MNRTLSAACAALLLAGSLTACGTTNTAAPNPGTDGVNDPGGTPSGTSYVAPRRTHYPNGANQDREIYNRMTSSRRTPAANDSARSNGRYTAYSDGYVYPGNNVLSPESDSGVIHDAARTARNMISGAGSMIRDAGNSVRNTVPGINDMTGTATVDPNASQRTGNNTLRNAE